MWDVTTGKPLLDTQNGVGRAMVAISPDGTLVTIGYRGGLVGADGHTSIWRIPDRAAAAARP